MSIMITRIEENMRRLRGENRLKILMIKRIITFKSRR